MPEAALPAVSELLAKWSSGNREAFRALIPLLYDELRQVARRYLRKARPSHTLQTTALVHEAYLRLEEHQHARFQNHAHFIAICALLMRQILIGHERKRRMAQRGAGFFGGLTVEETAEAMALPPATVKRHWSTARLWLHHEIWGDSHP